MVLSYLLIVIVIERIFYDVWLAEEREWHPVLFHGVQEQEEEGGQWQVLYIQLMTAYIGNRMEKYMINSASIIQKILLKIWLQCCIWFWLGLVSFCFTFVCEIFKFSC